jgi:hypothetical protein
MHRLDGKIELIPMSSRPQRPHLSSARRLQPTRFATPACAAEIWSPSRAWGNG